MGKLKKRPSNIIEAEHQFGGKRVILRNPKSNLIWNGKFRKPAK